MVHWSVRLATPSNHFSPSRGYFEYSEKELFLRKENSGAVPLQANCLWTISFAPGARSACELEGSREYHLLRARGGGELNVCQWYCFMPLWILIDILSKSVLFFTLSASNKIDPWLLLIVSNIKLKFICHIQRWTPFLFYLYLLRSRLALNLCIICLELEGH